MSLAAVPEDDVPRNSLPAAKPALMFPAFKPTPRSTQLAMILDWLSCCNLERSEVTCCLLHAGSRRLQSLCDHLLTTQCQNLEQLGDVCGQCTSCGALSRRGSEASSDVELECAFCNGDIVDKGGSADGNTCPRAIMAL